MTRIKWEVLESNGQNQSVKEDERARQGAPPEGTTGSGASQEPNSRKTWFFRTQKETLD